MRDNGYERPHQRGIDGQTFGPSLANPLMFSRDERNMLGITCTRRIVVYAAIASLQIREL